MSEDKVTLWGVGTMRTHRPIWFAREMGVDVEVMGIQSRTGETKEPEYLKINPRHKVPAAGAWRPGGDRKRGHPQLSERGVPGARQYLRVR